MRCPQKPRSTIQFTIHQPDTSTPNRFLYPPTGYLNPEPLSSTPNPYPLSPNRIPQPRTTSSIPQPDTRPITPAIFPRTYFFHPLSPNRILRPSNVQTPAFHVLSSSRIPPYLPFCPYFIITYIKHHTFRYPYSPTYTPDRPTAQLTYPAAYSIFPGHPSAPNDIPHPRRTPCHSNPQNRESTFTPTSPR